MNYNQISSEEDGDEEYEQEEAPKDKEEEA